MSIRRHTAFNLLGSVVPLVISLATIPLFLHLIGEARYGILAIAWLLLGYFGLFDFGLGRAAAQQIAALRGDSDTERAAIFGTAFWLNVALGVIGGLLIWPVAWYLVVHGIKIDAALLNEAKVSVTWLVLGVPLATITNVLSGGLQSRSRFFELNLISTAGTVLSQLAPIGAAMWVSPTLDVVLPAALSGRLISILFLYQRCHKHVCGASPLVFDMGRIGELLRFGSWVTVSSLIGPIMFMLDRFLLGLIVGAKGVSYYTVPFQLAERLTLLASALSGALFPRFAAADREELSRLTTDSLQFLLLLLTPVAIVAVLCLDPFLRFWISSGFADQAGTTGQILLLGFWLNSFARLPYAQLQARGRPDLPAKCHLLQVLPYLVGLYVLLDFWGIEGAAIAFSLRVAADFLILNHLAGMLPLIKSKMLLPSALMFGALAIATQDTLGQQMQFLLGLMLLFTTMVWCWTAMPIRLRQRLSDRLKNRRIPCNVNG